MPPRRRNTPGGRASVPPLPVDVHLPRHWRDREGGLRLWACMLEELTAAWLAEKPEELDPIRLSRFLDEAAFADREEGKRMVQHQADMLSEKVTAADWEEAYVKKWDAMSVHEREALFLDILSRSQEISEMQHGDSLGARFNCPEFSLEEMTGGDGSGLWRLVSALSTEGRIIDGERQIFVRNTAWEKKFGFNIDDETSLPPSKALRAYQEEMRLRRHSKLLEMTGGLLKFIRDPNAEFNLSERFKTPKPRAAERERGTVAVREGFLPKINSFDPTVKCCAGCYKTAAQIKPRTFSNCGRCYKIGRIVPYCSPQCQRNNYKGGWKHKESCGQPLQHSTLVPTFSAGPSVAALNIHLLNILRIAEAFPESRAVWWFVRPAVGSNPVRFNPLAVEEPFDTAQRDTERMIEIRIAAIHERDDDSLGILLAFLLECPGAVWDRAERGNTYIRGRGESAPEDFEMNDPNRSKIQPNVLRQQLKDAFEINEQRLVELITIGKAAVSQDGREVEREVLQRFINLREEEEMQKSMVEQGGKKGLAMGNWRWFAPGQRKQLTPEEFAALTLGGKKKGDEAAERERLEKEDGWESAESSEEEESDVETSSSVD
ncbi:hypothetical protein BCR35DRAFT_350466 [Leucosporidium creatinivorum]|uniref:MYND-type domain-containing protein n=1 Tax=Leucosporidium creatinivorum TaxID=106004 RepID=A0A1Y2G185_9BASI|nr:hypothetical protein BCR35DRAFT_350466 [Leucosporidium creatinivorum]